MRSSSALVIVGAVMLQSSNVLSTRLGMWIRLKGQARGTPRLSSLGDLILRESDGQVEPPYLVDVIICRLKSYKGQAKLIAT